MAGGNRDKRCKVQWNLMNIKREKETKRNYKIIESQQQLTGRAQFDKAVTTTIRKRK